MLAIFGLTRHTDLTRRLTNLIPRNNCSHPNCTYRKAPYQMPEHRFKIDSARQAGKNEKAKAGPEINSPLTRKGEYACDRSALKHWGDERMKVTSRRTDPFPPASHSPAAPAVTWATRWRLIFLVNLSPATDSYKIIDSGCVPVEGHEGYKKMCSYIEKGDGHLALIQREGPELDRPLDDILKWNPRQSQPQVADCATDTALNDGAA